MQIYIANNTHVNKSTIALTIMDLNDFDLIQDEKVDTLLKLFPQMCPSWLNTQVENVVSDLRDYWTMDQEEANREVEVRVSNLVERLISMSPHEMSMLPSYQTWVIESRRRREVERINSMTAEDFIRDMTDPVAHFNRRNRGPSDEQRVLYIRQSLAYLLSKYSRHLQIVIERVMRTSGSLLVVADMEIRRTVGTMRRPRPRTLRRQQMVEGVCLYFLKEKRFLEVLEDIERFQVARREEHALASDKGELEECSICLVDCLVREMVGCPAGHVYCGSCVARCVRDQVARGGSGECLVCTQDISTVEMTRVVDSQLVETVEQTRQIRDVMSAGLANLVSCPFCLYQVVMEDPADTVVVCLNPDCSKSSCRLCRKMSHLPLTCNEVGHERHMVEEELTRAVVRECHNCHIPFQRSSKCTIVQCSRCTSKTCYVCRKPVTDERGNMDHWDCRNGYAIDELHQDRKHEMELEKAKENIRKREDGSGLEDRLRDLFEARK